MRPPRKFSLSGSVPSKHLFGAVVIYYRRSLRYSIVQKLHLGKYFSLTPAFQRSLWKCVPRVSPLSGSVPSRYLFGAVAIYYRRSLQYSIVQKLLLGYVSHIHQHSRGLSGNASPPRVPSRVRYHQGIFFGAVAIYYRRSLQYSIVQKLFLRKCFPPSPAFQSCLWKRVPPVSSLSSSVPSRHLLDAVAIYYRGSL